MEEGISDKSPSGFESREAEKSASREKMAPSPEAVQVYIKAVRGLGVEINSLSPQKVFELCTHSKIAPLLESFSALSTPEEQQAFLVQNPILGKVANNIKKLLEAEAKQKELMKKNPEQRFAEMEEFVMSDPELSVLAGENLEYAELLAQTLVVLEQQFSRAEKRSVNMLSLLSNGVFRSEIVGRLKKKVKDKQASEKVEQGGEQVEQVDEREEQELHETKQEVHETKQENKTFGAKAKIEEYTNQPDFQSFSLQDKFKVYEETMANFYSKGEENLKEKEAVAFAKFEKLFSIIEGENIKSEEKEAITKIINSGIDFSDLARSFGGDGKDNEGIFDKVMDSDDVSAETKKLIRKEFDIQTGSDLQEALKSGQFDGEGNAYKFRENISAYQDSNGETVMEINLPGRNIAPVRIEGNEMWGEKLAERVNYLMVLQVMERMGMTDFLGQGIGKMDGASQIDFHDESHLNKSQRIQNTLLGGVREEGELLTNSEIKQMKHSLQWFRKKGDWAEDDYDRTASRDDLKELGIYNEGNQLDAKGWERFERAGDYIQRNYGTGAPDFDSLKLYLDVADDLDSSF
ncbi:hypothetical protein KAI58_04670 [Candidatus Gracilibacteria bacterium]|nr:hypothetical protein [Candidatus Gracilibacteria bacterium]